MKTRKTIKRVRVCECEAYPFCKHAPNAKPATARIVTTAAQARKSRKATVLAALRLWQRTYGETAAVGLLREWPEHFRDAYPLSLNRIDDLCEEINAGEVRL